MLLGLLLPMGVTAGATVGETVLDAPTAVVVHADDKSSSSKKDDKNSSSKEESSSSKSDSGSSDNQSAWDAAMSTLAQGATSEDDDKKSDASKQKGKNNQNSTDTDAKGPNDQADFDTVATGSGTWLNAWGFMGPDNDDVWQKANNSSWHTDFKALYSLANDVHRYNDANSNQVMQARGRAYMGAGRFAFAMQSMGLDQGAKDGLNPNSATNAAAGLIEQCCYVLLDNANSLFQGALKLLQVINPIDWAINGASNNQYFAPLSTVINKLYSLFHKLGYGIIGVILSLTLALAALGVTIGTNQASVGQGKAIINVFINLLKRLFVWSVLPIFSLFCFNYAVQSAQNMFQVGNVSVPNYAVYGSMVDYHDWVFNSRLGLPSGVTLTSSFNSKKLEPLTHAQIVKINQDGAGKTGLAALAQAPGGMYSTTSATDTVDATNGSGDTHSLDADAKAMIQSFKSGSSINASDYASAMTPTVKSNASLEDGKSSSSKGKAIATITGTDKHSKKTHKGSTESKASKGSEGGGSSSSSDSNDSGSSSDISQELVKAKYNNNADNNFGGDSADGGTIQGSAHSTGSMADPAAPAGSGNGLSGFGTYVYLLTTSDDKRMSIVNPEKLSNDVALPEHRNTIIVGTGIAHTGNLVWGFGMIVGLTMIVVGYLLEVLKTIIEAIPGLASGTFETAMGSVRGGVKLVSVVAAVLIGIFGSAVMFLIANKAFIAIADMSDLILQGVVGQGGLATLTQINTDTDVGMLLSGVNNMVASGAANLFEGVFLLYVAWLLLHYRSVVVASLASLVEETMNKVMASFGSLTGQGSAGTRGQILANSNTKNTIGNKMGALARSAVPYAGMMAAGNGLKSLAKNAGLTNGKGQNKNTAGKNNEKKQAERSRTSQFGARSSANKQGYANQRVAQLAHDRSLRERSGNQIGGMQNNGRREGGRQNAAGLATKLNDDHGLRQAANDLRGDENRGDLRSLAYNPALDSPRDTNQIGGIDNGLRDNARDSNRESANRDSMERELSGNNNFQELGNDTFEPVNDNANDLMGNTSQDGQSLSEEQESNQLSPEERQAREGQAQLERSLGMDREANKLEQSLGDSRAQRGTAAERTANRMGDVRQGDQHHAQRQGDLRHRSAAELNNQANGLTNAYGTNAGQNGHMTQAQQAEAQALGNQSRQSQMLGMSTPVNGLNTENTANHLTSTPVNKNATASRIQSRMGDVAQANALNMHQQQLASANPNNKTLAAQATQSSNRLQSLQSNALRDYNSQAISSKMPQASWLQKGADHSQISVGTANSAVNNVYQAQQKLAQAQSRFGSTSPQVQQAKTALQHAQQQATKAGLSSNVVGNTEAIQQAHQQIEVNTKSIMNGTWRPQMQNNDVAHIGGSQGHTIGL